MLQKTYRNVELGFITSNVSNPTSGQYTVSWQINVCARQSLSTQINLKGIK
jgi:hypothetical protein